MELEIKKDGKGQLYIEWPQAENSYKRAWIQHRKSDGDWAGTVRYLNVVRCDSPGHPSGPPADFPIYNQLPDEQILLAFVRVTNAITGLDESRL